MKNKKRFLTVLIVLLVLLVPLFAATTEEASLTITTMVGENVTNTGIRLTQDSTAFASTAFDTKFFAAASIITLSNTTQDSSLVAISGNFSVLVRRQRSQAVQVTLDAAPLTNGTYNLQYTLTNVSNTQTPITITSATKTLGYLTPAGSETGNIIRHQNIFKYDIPADLNAPRGTYSANIKVTMTAG